jgi:16S rRNA processing protein RimM
MEEPTDNCKLQTANSRLIEMGVFSSVHGVRGQIKIKSYTSQPEAIADYPSLQDKQGNHYKITITGQADDMLIASVEGINSRNDAERLKNTKLYVPRSALPKLKKGEHYQEDLIGLKLSSPDGKEYGTVISVHNFGAGTLVNIRLVNGQEEYMPFNKTIFSKVDTDALTAIIDPPFIVKPDKENG